MGTFSTLSLEHRGMGIQKIKFPIFAKTKHMKSILFLSLCAILLFFSCKKKDVPISAPASSTGATSSGSLTSTATTSTLTTTGATVTPKTFGFIIAGDSSSDGVHYFGGKQCGYDNNTYMYFNTIDFDKDGVNDLKFEYGADNGPTTVTAGEQVTGINSTFTAFVCVDSKGYPLALNKGDTIGHSLNWVGCNTTMLVMSWERDTDPVTGNVSYNNHGNWNDENNKYFGVKLSNSTKTYYCWVRFVNKSILDIQDYAYRQ